MKTNLKSTYKWLICLSIFMGLISSTTTVLADSNVQANTQSQPGALPAISNPTPVLAYFYIWYDTTSWNRAKIDYPLLGRYSSDDPAVMRQQIIWAKEAGIKGFIVSWKSTDVLNRRLEQLAEIAGEEKFSLAIIYQGLDFNRNPLPVNQVASDLDYFIQKYAKLPVFNLYPKPLVILSGTWKFSPKEIAQLTEGRRDKLLLLASEKNVAGYQQIANLVDGNAYYWSSVNPDTYPDYEGKLIEMGQVVHQHGGIWIPPAAPGFDAHLIGGTSLVARNNGQTFRKEVNAAQASSPDALGIISWNEFSENSYIEPSLSYGGQYLGILSEINHLPAPQIGEFDSSEPLATYPEVVPASRYFALGGLAVIFITGFIVIARRNK